jgi:hypothetical protein
LMRWAITKPYPSIPVRARALAVTLDQTVPAV